MKNITKMSFFILPFHFKLYIYGLIYDSVNWNLYKNFKEVKEFLTQVGFTSLPKGVLISPDCILTSGNIKDVYFWVDTIDNQKKRVQSDKRYIYPFKKNVFNLFDCTDNYQIIKLKNPLVIDQYSKRRRSVFSQSQPIGYFIGQKEPVDGSHWEKIVGTNYIHISDNKSSTAKFKYDIGNGLLNLAVMDPRDLNDQGIGIYTKEDNDFFLAGLMMGTESIKQNNKFPETSVELLSKPVNSWIDYIVLKSILGEEVSIPDKHQESKSLNDKMGFIAPNIILAYKKDNDPIYTEIKWKNHSYPIVENLFHHNYVIYKCFISDADVVSRCMSKTLNEKGWFLNSSNKTFFSSDVKEKYVWQNNLSAYPVKILKGVSNNSLNLEKVGDHFPAEGSFIFNNEVDDNKLVGFSKKFESGKGNEIFDIKKINSMLDYIIFVDALENKFPNIAIKNKNNIKKSHYPLLNLFQEKEKELTWFMRYIQNIELGCQPFNQPPRTTKNPHDAQWSNTLTKLWSANNNETFILPSDWAMTFLTEPLFKALACTPLSYDPKAEVLKQRWLGDSVFSGLLDEIKSNEFTANEILKVAGSTGYYLNVGALNKPKNMFYFTEKILENPFEIRYESSNRRFTVGSQSASVVEVDGISSKVLVITDTPLFSNLCKTIINDLGIKEPFFKSFSSQKNNEIFNLLAIYSQFDNYKQLLDDNQVADFMNRKWEEKTSWIIPNNDLMNKIVQELGYSDFNDLSINLSIDNKKWLASLFMIIENIKQPSQLVGANSSFDYYSSWTNTLWAIKKDKSKIGIKDSFWGSTNEYQLKHLTETNFGNLYELSSNKAFFNKTDTVLFNKLKK